MAHPHARLLLPFLLALASCRTGGTEDLVLSVSADPTPDGTTIAALELWVKALPEVGAPVLERHRLEIDDGHDLVRKPLRVEVENSRSLDGDVLLHLVGVDSDGAPLATASEHIVFPRSGDRALRLTTLVEGCDLDGDGFPGCDDVACCAHIDADVRDLFSDCLDDPARDSDAPPEPGRPVRRVRADEVHPFFDRALEASRSYWCANGISNGCGELVSCDLVDADGDGYPASEEGPADGEASPNIDCDDNDDGRSPGEAEVCNGIDEDCDGTADNGVLNACDACGPLGEELCDGVDNDCDGQLDEGWDVGIPCVEQGVCGDGGFICSPQGERVCSSAPGQPDSPALEEACNGLDDDCDGRTDEEWPDLTGACDAGGDCGAGSVICGAGGRESCCSADPLCDPEIDPNEELCDDVDNDCDGQTDEGHNLDGACPSVGACPIGLVECAGPRETRCSTGPRGSDDRSSPELCNGIDDDCDGNADDGWNLGTPCGVGACAGGILQCLNDNATVCSTHPGGLGDLSSEEVCDALDNDCNGVPDDAVPNDGGPCQVEGQLGECRAGVFRCRGVQGLVCGQVIFAAIEVCDSLDNDCDGEVDDNADDIGAACNVGVGACLRGGVTVCRDGGEVCSAVAGQPAAEICDGIDNNCDGNVDGDVVDDNEPCSAGLGPCRENGVEVCGGGELVCDAVARDGSPEICNGRDDDCNGQIDDDAAEVGDVCARGLGPCRRLGQKLCVNDGLECSVEAGQPGVETCNDIDDDCDGQVDNDAAEVGDLCVRGVGECERSGQKTCAGGELGCSAVVALPSNELCNGLDDDCNGVDDNDLTDDGGPCSEGLGVCLQAGTDQCVGGGLQCDAVAGQPIALACDGDDNDCDGQPDVLPDLTCGDGICANTVPACVDDEDNACEPLDVAVIEIPANELDDDCDGEVDEL